MLLKEFILFFSSTQSQSGDLSTARSELESTRADLRQSETTKTDLTKELTELASTRDLEKNICGMKKSVVDDYVDAVDAAVAVYQVSFTQRQRFPVLLKLHNCMYG